MPPPRRKATRVIIALAVALGAAIVASYALTHVLGTGRFPERPVFLVTSIANCGLVLFYVFMGQSIVEDGIVSIVILLLILAVAHGTHVWAIPLSIFTGLLLAMVANVYVREIVYS
jgi:hypothetical protein